METVFIEAMHEDRNGNHGKFMVGRFTPEEWARRSQVDPDMGSLLHGRGHAPHHLLVVDLETCEGAVFSPGGLASADLEKHQIWVCPLFPHFLSWLYKQDLRDLDALPRVVTFTKEEAEFALYRERQVKCPDE